ncbi:hypothetical protein [Shinella sp. HZN7]|uniref:hypothetical protein n=1 Tax=Shinella sp. (strain HZN7) TaxID=879274 RepID=UPI000A986149|nr:hypothetical protein [Shinella sp. HZN7]
MALSAAKPLIRRHTELGIFLIGAVLIVLFSTTSDGKWANCWFPRRTEPVRRIISIEN